MMNRSSQSKQMKGGGKAKKMMCGGKTKHMKKGGLTMRGCGAATRGRKFSRNG